MKAHVITPTDIQQSYKLLHLLDVLAHATRTLEYAGESEIGRLSGGIAACLDICHELAGPLHDLLEFNVEKEGGDRA